MIGATVNKASETIICISIGLATSRQLGHDSTNDFRFLEGFRPAKTKTKELPIFAAKSGRTWVIKKLAASTLGQYERDPKNKILGQVVFGEELTFKAWEESELIPIEVQNILDKPARDKPRKDLSKGETTL